MQILPDLVLTNTQIQAVSMQILQDLVVKNAQIQAVSIQILQDLVVKNAQIQAVSIQILPINALNLFSLFKESQRWRRAQMVLERLI